MGSPSGHSFHPWIRRRPGPGSANRPSVRHVSRRAETRQGRALQDGRRPRRRDPERGSGRPLEDLSPGHLQVDLDHPASAVQGDRGREAGRSRRTGPAGPISPTRPRRWRAPSRVGARRRPTSGAATATTAATPVAPSGHARHQRPLPASSEFSWPSPARARAGPPAPAPDERDAGQAGGGGAGVVSAGGLARQHLERVERGAGRVGHDRRSRPRP